MDLFVDVYSRYTHGFISLKISLIFSISLLNSKQCWTSIKSKNQRGSSWLDRWVFDSHNI